MHRSALRWLLRLGLLLDILTSIVWLLTIQLVITVVPLAATIGIFVFHLRSARQLKHQGYISSLNIKGQLILGFVIIACLMMIIAFLANLSFTSQGDLPIILISIGCYSVMASLALAPWLLNQQLRPY